MGVFDSSIGAIMISAWLCSMLEVVIIDNVYQYFSRFKNDHILLKLLVGFTVFIDAVGMIGCYGLIYMTTVTYWGNPYILTYQKWPIPLILLSVDLVAYIVQNFLIYRVWVLTRNWIISLIIAMVSLISFISCIWIATLYTTYPLYTDRYKAKTQVIVWVTTISATDVLVTAALIWHFSNMKTSFKKTETILRRLIRGAMQTGAATALCAILTLFFYLISSGTNLGAATVFLLARFYALTLLYNLNLRGPQASTALNYENANTNGHTMTLNPFPTQGMLGGIEIHRTAHVHIDGVDNNSESDQKDGTYAPERTAVA